MVPITVKKLVAAAATAISLLAGLSPAFAQTSPNWSYGFVPTPGQWNAEFASKQDYLGTAPCLTSGCTLTGRLTTVASTTNVAGFNLPTGVAPTSPIDGDLWVTTSGIYVRINGATVGPLTGTAVSAPITVNLNSAPLPAAQSGAIIQASQADATANRVELDSWAATGFFTCVRADGTAASPTTLVANDEICSFNAWGYDGTSRAGSAASVRLFAGGTWSNTSHPTYIDFGTTAAASTTNTSRLHIESDGGVTLNGASSGGAGTITSNLSVNSSSGISFTNTNTGTASVAQLSLVNNAGSFIAAGMSGSNTTGYLANRSFILGSGSGLIISTSGAIPIDFYINQATRAGGFTSAGALDLGVAGTNVGSIVLHNATSGGVTLQPVTGALGTVTINVPASAGTMAVSATSPVTLSAAGAIACPTCIAGTITLSGDVSGSGSNAITTTLATVNSNVGTFGSATQVGQFTVNGKGLITAASNVTVTPAVGSITGFGTGVGTALATNVGTAGSFVTNGGALGTPSSGTLTNATGLPISTGVSGLGSGVAAALGTTLNATSGLCTYQVGTWTPSFTGSTTSGTGQTYTLGPTGSYETCGRLVVARFSMQASSLGTAAGNLQISGLPFTATSSSTDYGSCYVSVYAVTGLAASNFGVTGLIAPSATLVQLFSHANTGVNAVTIAQAGSTVEMIGACIYRT